MAELMALGFRSVPVTVIGGQAIRGFKPNLVSRALGLGLGVSALGLDETIPLLGRTLEAVERAARQIPDDKLNWTAPGRDRPMSEFVYHIFAEAESRSAVLETGEYSHEGHEKGRFYESFQGIADYGAGVVERYRAWASRQDVEALCLTPAGGPDNRSPGERLDVLTGHTIQHLRQIYWVLEHFDITPEGRIQDSEFPPEFVLTKLW